MLFVLLSSLALSVGAAPRDAVEARFLNPSDDVDHLTSWLEPQLGVDELLAPFVAQRRFRWPFVKVVEDGSDRSTHRYDAEGMPATVDEALRVLREEKLSFVLRYEEVDVADWPPALKALLPRTLADELMTRARQETLDIELGDPGVTIHCYLSAPGVVALDEHADAGDVLAVHLAGAKEWSLDDRDVLLTPGDALWLPAGQLHSARATGDDISAHLTIHRVTEESITEARRLNHITGYDGTKCNELDEYTGDDDPGCKVYRNDKWEVTNNDLYWNCPSNLNFYCRDEDKFCVDSVAEVARVNPCCYPDNRYEDDECDYDTVADVDFWVPLDAPKKSCAWIAEDPSERCSTLGVLIEGESHYGKKWLLENQPRYRAQDACPVTCASYKSKIKAPKCTKDSKDDPDWRYSNPAFQQGGMKSCADVAEAPAARCDWRGFAAPYRAHPGKWAENPDWKRTASEACCESCGSLKDWTTIADATFANPTDSTIREYDGDFACDNYRYKDPHQITLTARNPYYETSSSSDDDDYADTSCFSQGLLKFDLSGLSGAVDQATLRLVSDRGGVPWFDIEGYRMTQSWDAETTWESLGGDCVTQSQRAKKTSFAFKEDGPSRAVDVDVTNDVSAWLAGEPNEGWVLQLGEVEKKGPTFEWYWQSRSDVKPWFSFVSPNWREGSSRYIDKATQPTLFVKLQGKSGDSSDSESSESSSQGEDNKKWRFKGMKCKDAAKAGKCFKKGKDKKTKQKLGRGVDECRKSCADA
mmetsp:Transcript_9352/g.28015  ORF Transcript_9352/g.28015 Transcript_9352/m.28015 type:complete len:757 (+) Transcript_9352:80-2350(+)